MLGALLFASACAAGVNPQVDSPDAAGAVAGFWMGLWQGAIAPIAFIVSLFSDAVTIYEVHNRGHLYDLGFLLGLSSVWGGGSHAAKRRRG